MTINFGLRDKVALITGGSRGIGKEIACQMAREGVHVVACARKLENLEKVQQEMRQEGLDLLIHQAHVAKADQVISVIDYIKSSFGHLDILVNNVGMNIFTPSVLEADEDLFNKIMDTNIKGSFMLCKYAVPLMKTRKAGKIINLSTVAARRAAPGMGIYGIAKAAVDMLTKVLAVELAPHNIQVNAVAPCMVRTDFSKPFWSNDSALVEINRSIPLGRIAEPSEVAGVVLFLASSASDFMTGEVVTVDGGLMAK
jgi:NAD(P)-dependent dehydrogenase (short-subunit alcohol dehydrogenase family)